MLATTEGSQIAALCAEDFDWDLLLDDPSFLLACERPTERAGLAAALESLRMLVGFADHTGRTGLVTIRDFLPHLLFARSPEIEPPQQNSSCIATPCSIASNGSRS